GVVGLGKPGLAAHAGQVGPGAEGLLAGAREHDHAHLVVGLGLGRRLPQAGDHVPRHGVAALGPIDRDPRHVPSHVVEQCPFGHRAARYLDPDMRFTLIAVALGFVLALLVGGRPRYLSDKRFRWWLLLPAGLALQLVAVESLGDPLPFALLLLSYACLVAF